MASTTDKICILCELPYSESDKKTIGERAIISVIDASKRRKDGKHGKLEELVSLNVHKQCHAAYIRENNIKAAEKQVSQDYVLKRKKLKLARKFDFQHNCFICGLDTENHPSGNPISLVSSDQMKNSILEGLQRLPRTDFNNDLKHRLENASNLQEKRARYHRKCLSNFFTYRPTNCNGRPIEETMSSVTEHVISFILDNADDSQFSLKEILTSFDGELPRLDRITDQLKNHFGEEMEFFKIPNDTIICYKDTQGKTLKNEWYSQKAPTEAQERLRVVEMAANIVCQDIRERHYDTLNYNAPSSFFIDVESDIPPSLLLFLNTLIKSHKRKEETESDKWINRISTLAHIIISFVRPRTFLSSILLGLSSMIHKKFAAKGLIDSLSHLGLCTSYRETQLFEKSITNDPEQYKVSGDLFVQFVYDNADHDSATIDRRGTFHAMGGIMCVTPSSCVTSNKKIPKVKSNSPLDAGGKFGFLPLRIYEKPLSGGLKTVPVTMFDDHTIFRNNVDISMANLVWLHEKMTKPTDTVGWSGFHEKIHVRDVFSTSKIIPLPFVNNPPSDLNTIFTVLVDAAEKSIALSQERCIVTFDQPLYWKAREMLSRVDTNNDSHNLSCITVRLGVFTC